MSGEVENRRKLNKAINMEDVMMIPHKVMRYVVRTGEAVLVDKKPSIGLFANDSYFDDKVKISLLCIPIKIYGCFLQVLSTLEMGVKNKNNTFTDS